MATDVSIFTDVNDEGNFRLPKYRLLAVDPVDNDDTESKFIVALIEVGWDTEENYNTWLHDRNHTTGMIGTMGIITRLKFEDARYVYE
jgi:hypothetical protein